MNYQKEIFNIEEILFHFEMMAENFSFSSSEYFVSILNNLIDMYDPKTFVLNKTKAKRPTISNHFFSLEFKSSQDLSTCSIYFKINFIENT